MDFLFTFSYYLLQSIDVLGRKPFLMFVQILCGISCICAGLISDANLRLLFSLVGKFGSSAAFSAVFLYTAELFPTSMRNSAVGMCSTLARFGGILAPTVAQLGNAMVQLEPSCCKKWQKKSPGQKTGLENRGRLKVLNDTKLVLNEHE